MTGPVPLYAGPVARPDEPSRERILRVATQLFADRGFAGVTTREIAAAAELNVATVAHHVGSKADLYEAVLGRLHERESAMLDDALGGLTDDVVADPVAVRAVLGRLLDRYVDVLAAEPAIAALWTRRWLERGTPGDDVEQRFARPVLARVEQVLQAAQRAGALPPLDAHLAVKSIVWITYGWFTGGLVEDERRDVTDPEQIARLRRFAHRVADGLLGQP